MDPFFAAAVCRATTIRVERQWKDCTCLLPAIESARYYGWKMAALSYPLLCVLLQYAERLPIGFSKHILENVQASTVEAFYQRWHRPEDAAVIMAGDVDAAVCVLLQYAERLPIGLKEIVENVPASTVKAFYQRWYRPENMAVIVAGDFDPATVENLLKSAMSTCHWPSDIPATPVPT